jgi:hypothetical protein
LIIVVATQKTKISPQLAASLLAADELYVTYETYDNFDNSAVKCRPVSFMSHLLANGRVDKVVQVGYNGIKHELVQDAESFDIDAVLYRSGL